MISNHLNLVEQHRSDAELISEQIAQYLATGGRIDQLKSPPRNPLPPPRSKKIDPETVLKRRRPKPISAADRKTLRKMADSI
jgi:hypothetical protein